MPTLPIHNTVPPSVASTFPNGGPVPSHLLRDPGDGLGSLLVLPSLGMQALHLLAAENGFYVETTGRGRTLSLQTSTFLNRYTPSYNQLVNTTSDQRVCVLDQRSIHPSLYPGHRWYKRKGEAAAAAPGTSPHGKWVADDLSQEYDGDPATDPVTEAFIRWLVPIADDLGFAWSLQSEPWHVQWIAGDRLPALVVSTLNRYGIPIPGTWPAPTPEAPPMATLRGGSVRILDTRTNGGKLRPGEARRVGVLQPPASWARAAIVDVGVSDTEGHGFTVVWSGEGDMPNTSAQDYPPGSTYSNTWHVPLSGSDIGGWGFSVYTLAGAHIVVDLQGYDSVI